MCGRVKVPLRKNDRDHVRMLCGDGKRDLRIPKQQIFLLLRLSLCPHSRSLVLLLTEKSQQGCLTQHLHLQNRVWEVSWWLCQAADAKCWGHCSTLLYLPATTCSCPRHWWFHTVWCQPAASTLPTCCALPWLTDPLLSQTEKPPLLKGILCQGEWQGRSGIRLHGLTDTNLPHPLNSDVTGLDCLGLRGLTHSLPCQHCHILTSGSKRFPHGLPLTNPSAPTL